MSLAIGGWSVVSSAGVGRSVFEGALAGSQTVGDGSIPGFDVRALLGRRGTSTLDRRSALVLVTCEQARDDAGLTIDDTNREVVGTVIGTTWGSLGSMMDYSRDTLVEDRPYMVNPLMFPNTVMNCAGGQVAIRIGARGPSITVAGGRLALFHALNTAHQILHCGRAATLFVGVAEELTPHTRAALQLTSAQAVVASEGAAMFVVQMAGERSSAGEILGVALGFVPRRSGGLARGLQRAIRAACARAHIAPSQIDRAGVAASVDAAADEEALAATAPCERLALRPWLGDARTANAGFMLCDALLTRGHLTLLIGSTRDGAVAAAVVRG